MSLEFPSPGWRQKIQHNTGPFLLLRPKEKQKVVDLVRGNSNTIAHGSIIQVSMVVNPSKEFFQKKQTKKHRDEAI